MSNSLAVIGLPHVRQALEGFGFEVISGEGFPDVSRRIRDAAATSALPVLVEDHKQIGLEQLISRLPENSPVVIVRGGQPILGQTRSSIPLTSSLGDYLGALGFADLDPALKSIHVDADGTVPMPPPESPALLGHGDEPSAARPDETEPSPAPADPVEDWLMDESDTAVTPDPSPARATGEDEPAAAASELSDWLEDTEDTEAVEAQPRGEDPGAEDEEDFDGFHSPTPPVHSAESAPVAGSRSHRAQVEPDKDSPALLRRRRISLPTFADGNDTALATDPSPEVELLDEELFANLPETSNDVEADEDLEVDAAVDAVTGPSASKHRRRRTATADVIVAFSGKGGEGKSALSLALAQAAAEVAGLSVCLIDANRAQGDLGLYLRVRTSGLASIYDAVAIGDLASAILSPDQLSDARQGRGDHLAFSFVQAPRPVKDSADIAQEISAVTAEHYAEVIQIARERFDLVVIDTQITEALDPSGLIDRVVGPLLARGGYGVGICELTTPGVENLLVAIESLSQRGADRARIMSIANKVRPSITDYGRLPQLLGRISKWKGAVHYDERIYDDLVARRIPYAVPTLHGVVMDVLHSVAGDEEFNLRANETGQPALPWWKRWLRR